ncbi:unnamed protein product [Polarella glacialis]|uniref:Uncharacterized protein n=1 Tax=Polarella glacialis TaxID=89957 RepID=A0A813KRM9_POLGL|nr:unnamed protein product [Polarella glacialis]CAE8706268.1 unnamed protein product [Polarella glacialis]
MPFFDWFGFLGTGIQSTFAWVGYNRDGFADNVSWRQNQKYQQKNYHISWIAIARDDIRDMMGISVNRINNYMIVATLILSVAAGSVVSVSFDSDCPDFIVFAYYLTSGVSLIFLMLAIMFGVKGQNSAFTNTMKLLTYQVRPENPAEYTHDYMKQSQWVERNGLASLLRIPGIMPSYNTDTQKDHMIDVGGKMKAALGSEQGGGASQGKASLGYAGSDSDNRMGEINLEEATPLESLVQRSTHTWYLTKFAEFMKLWHPYDMYSKYAMGLGIVCLVHSSAYFTLGTISVHDYAYAEYAACIVTFAIMLMVGLIINMNFRKHSMCWRITSLVIITAGPTFSALAAITQNEAIRQILVPVSFFCHFLLWVGVLCLSRTSEWQVSGMSGMKAGAGFWPGKKNYQRPSESSEAEQKKQSQMQKDLSQGFEGSSTEDGKRSHSYWHQQQELKQKEWQQWQRESSEVIGSASSSRAHHPLQRTAGHDLDDNRQPSCWPRGVSTCLGAEAALAGGSHVASSSAAGRKQPTVGNKSIQRMLQTGDDEECPDHWPTDDWQFDIRASSTSALVKTTMRNTILCVASIWLAGFIWAVLRYWVDESSNAWKWPETVRAQVQDTPFVLWPSTLFRPTTLACANSFVFTSDGFRIHQLSTEGRPSQAVSCPGLDRPIIDLDVACDPEGCRPVALVASRDNGASLPEIVDCRGGAAKSLLQDQLAAERFSVLGRCSGYLCVPSNVSEQNLLTARHGEMVKHEWSAADDAWRPDVFLGEVSFLKELGGFDSRPLTKSEGLLAVSTAGSEVVFFRRVNPSRPAIEVRDALTMASRGQWVLPEGLPPIEGGCAESSNSLLVLLRSGALAGSGKPGLVRLSLG